MAFGHRTPNETGRLRRKPQIMLGHDVDAYQAAAWLFSGFVGLVVLLAADVSLPWKALTAAAAAALALLLSARDGEGRTAFRQLRILARRAARGSLAVDRGADTAYFRPRPGQPAKKDGTANG